MIVSKLKKSFVKFWFCKIKHDKIGYSRFLGVRMGEGCQVLADPEYAFGTEPWLIKLGDHVDVTAGVHFLNHEGGIWCARGLDKKYEALDIFAPTEVGDNVMIGMNSLIMPGIKIGSNVIIAGHCVITKDIPDNSIVAGVPGKIIGHVDAFIDKLELSEKYETKRMSQTQKREFLKKVHPEWFE